MSLKSSSRIAAYALAVPLLASVACRRSELRAPNAAKANVTENVPANQQAQRPGPQTALLVPCAVIRFPDRYNDQVVIVRGDLLESVEGGGLTGASCSGLIRLGESDEDLFSSGGYGQVLRALRTTGMGSAPGDHGGTIRLTVTGIFRYTPKAPSASGRFVITHPKFSDVVVR